MFTYLYCTTHNLIVFRVFKGSLLFLFYIFLFLCSFSLMFYREFLRVLCFRVYTVMWAELPEIKLMMMMMMMIATSGVIFRLVSHFFLNARFVFAIE